MNVPETLERSPAVEGFAFTEGLELLVRGEIHDTVAAVWSPAFYFDCFDWWEEVTDTHERPFSSAFEYRHDVYEQGREKLT